MSKCHVESRTGSWNRKTGKNWGIWRTRFSLEGWINHITNCGKSATRCQVLITGMLRVGWVGTLHCRPRFSVNLVYLQQCRQRTVASWAVLSRLGQPSAWHFAMQRLYNHGSHLKVCMQNCSVKKKHTSFPWSWNTVHTCKFLEAEILPSPLWLRNHILTLRVRLTWWVTSPFLSQNPGATWQRPLPQAT